MLLWLKCQAAHRAITYSVACKTHSPEGWKTPRIELDSGLFTVRAATRPRQMGRAARQSGVRASPVEIRLGGQHLQGVAGDAPIQVRATPARQAVRLQLPGVGAGAQVTQLLAPPDHSYQRSPFPSGLQPGNLKLAIRVCHLPSESMY